MHPKKLAVDAMLAAMCAVLGYLAIDLTVIKVTFEGLPVILGGLLFGPLHGMAIGAVGTLIYQLLRYGFSTTTLLWILPYVLCGLIAGLYARSRCCEYSRAGLIIIALICELTVTVLNTGVIYLDSVIYNYYFPGIVTGSLALRLGISVAKGIVFGLALDPVIKGARTVVSRERS